MSSSQSPTINTLPVLNTIISILLSTSEALSDLRDQIGIGDNKENMKHVKGARRLADNAARDHAHMIRAYRVK